MNVYIYEKIIFLFVNFHGFRYFLEENLFKKKKKKENLNG